MSLFRRRDPIAELADATVEALDELRVAVREMLESAAFHRAAAEELRREAVRRDATEDDRVTAEGSRVGSEVGRVVGEHGRVTAEEGRVDAEGSRVEAEGDRVERDRRERRD